MPAAARAFTGASDTPCPAGGVLGGVASTTVPANAYFNVHQLTTRHHRQAAERGAARAAGLASATRTSDTSETPASNAYHRVLVLSRRCRGSASLRNETQ